MLYTKYESSEPCSFRQEDFWMFHFKKPIYWPRDLLMQPTGTIWTTLIGDHPRIISVKFGQVPISGYREDIVWSFLVWNYKAQSFHIWYIASSRGPLPKLFKLCPWGQNWPSPGGHNFTLNYIRKSSQTTSFLEPLMGIWPNSTGMVPL